MALQFNCQHCNELIISKFLKVGEIAECKKCGEKNTIPKNAEDISDSEIKPEHTISDVFDDGSNKQTNSKTSEKITLMDGIKWLEGLCKRLIPITLFVILGMLCFELANKLIDGRDLLSVRIDGKINTHLNGSIGTKVSGTLTNLMNGSIGTKVSGTLTNLNY